MEWIFALEVFPDAEVTCEGTKQPIYLFANLVIVSLIIALASADVLDACRFWRTWDELIVSRGRMFPTPVALFGEKAEAGFVYVLRGLVLLTSTRPYKRHYTEHCEDEPIMWLSLILSYATTPFFSMLLLSSFVHGTGPAPPRGVVEKRPYTAEARHHIGDSTGGGARPPLSYLKKKVALQPKHEFEGELGHLIDHQQSVSTLTVASADGSTTRTSGIRFQGTVVNDGTKAQCRVRWREQEFWHEVDPILSNRERCALSHKLFHRTGLLCRGLRAGGVGYILRLLLWKLKQVIKITFGVWDDAALLAARIMPRAGALLPSATFHTDQRVAVGLQCHQDIISVSARFIATMWIYVPLGAVVTRISEALHVAPIFVSDGFVSDTAFARWDPNFRGFQAERGAHYPQEDDRAVVVMNSGRRFRIAETLLAVSMATSEIWFILAPHWGSASTMMLLSLLNETLMWIFKSPYQDLYMRRQEWQRAKKQRENETPWDEFYRRLEVYRAEQGDCLVPKRHVTSDGGKLGQWVSDQRKARKGKRGGLSVERTARLEALGFVWDTLDASGQQGASTASIACTNSDGPEDVAARGRADDGPEESKGGSDSPATPSMDYQSRPGRQIKRHIRLLCYQMFCTQLSRSTSMARSLAQRIASRLHLHEGNGVSRRLVYCVGVASPFALRCRQFMISRLCSPESDFLVWETSCVEEEVWKRCSPVDSEWLKNTVLTFPGTDLHYQLSPRR
jgi:hypothetical protein